MWKNVDLEACYRSRFIGFTDLSPRSDTEFGLAFSGINWQDNWMSFFSRMKWKVDEMVACRKVFVQIVYTWDTYRYLFLHALFENILIFVFSFLSPTRQTQLSNTQYKACLDKSLKICINDRSFLCSASFSLLRNLSCITHETDLATNGNNNSAFFVQLTSQISIFLNILCVISVFYTYIYIVLL